MKIQTINETKNHIHICKITQENSVLSGTLCVPSKTKDNIKYTIQFAYTKDVLSICDSHHLIKKEIDSSNIYSYLIHLISYLINDDIYYLEKIDEKLNKIEDDLTLGKDSHFEKEIFKYRKNITSFHAYYEQLLEFIQCLQGFIIEERYDVEINLSDNLSKKIERLTNVTLRLQEYSNQLREMHHTQVEMKQNQIMQLLTIVTTIFMPLTLLTGWYGMNFKNMPELASNSGYFVLIIICIIIIIIEVIYFKKKKWF